MPGSGDGTVGRDVAVLAKGTGITLLGRSTGRLLQFGTQVVLARGLGAAEYGLYALAWSLLRITAQLGVAGLDSGVVHFGSRGRSDPARLKGAIAEAVGLAAVISVGIALVTGVNASRIAVRAFSKPAFASLIAIVSLGAVFAALARVLVGAARVTQRAGGAVLIEDVVQPTILFAWSLAVAVSRWDVRYAVAGVDVSFAAATFVGVAVVLRSFPDAFRRGVVAVFRPGEMLKFSLAASIATVFSMFVLWMTPLLIGLFLPPAEVGRYSAASQVAQAFLVVVSSFSMIFAPMIADLYHRGERERVQSLLRITTKWSTYASWPFFAVVAVMPGTFLTVFFGRGYREGAAVLVIMSAAQLVSAVGGAVGMVLLMTGQQVRWMRITALFFALSVVGNLLLIPRFGIRGAAFATAMAIAGAYAVGLWIVSRRVHLWPFDRRHGRVVVPAACSALVVVGIRELRIGLPAVQVGLAVLLAYAVFAGIVLIRGLDDEERYVGRLVAARVASILRSKG